MGQMGQAWHSVQITITRNRGSDGSRCKSKLTIEQDQAFETSSFCLGNEARSSCPKSYGRTAGHDSACCPFSETLASSEECSDHHEAMKQIITRHLLQMSQTYS